MLKDIKDVRYLESKLEEAVQKRLNNEIEQETMDRIDEEIDKFIGDTDKIYELKDLSEETKKILQIKKE